jgi:hypothetical protein
MSAHETAARTIDSMYIILFISFFRFLDFARNDKLRSLHSYCHFDLTK